MNIKKLKIIELVFVFLCVIFLFPKHAFADRTDIWGKVTYEDGTPVVGQRVHIRTSSWPWDSGGVRDDYVNTDANGHFGVFRSSDHPVRGCPGDIFNCFGLHYHVELQNVPAGYTPVAVNSVQPGSDQGGDYSSYRDQSALTDCKTWGDWFLCHWDERTRWVDRDTDANSDFILEKRLIPVYPPPNSSRTGLTVPGSNVFWYTEMVTCGSSGCCCMDSDPQKFNRYYWPEYDGSLTFAPTSGTSWGWPCCDGCSAPCWKKLEDWSRNWPDDDAGVAAVKTRWVQQLVKIPAGVSLIKRVKFYLARVDGGWYLDIIDRDTNTSVMPYTPFGGIKRSGRIWANMDRGEYVSVVKFDGINAPVVPDKYYWVRLIAGGSGADKVDNPLSSPCDNPATVGVYEHCDVCFPWGSGVHCASAKDAAATDDPPYQMHSMIDVYPDGNALTADASGNIPSSFDKVSGARRADLARMVVLGGVAPPSGSITADGNDVSSVCNITAGNTSCSSVINWTTASTTNAVVCLDTGSGESLFASSTSASVASCYDSSEVGCVASNIFSGRNYVFRLKAAATCEEGGEILDSVVVTASPSPQTIDFCISSVNPWVQMTTGDIRMPFIDISAPGNVFLSDNATYPSLFFSSYTTASLGNGYPSQKCSPVSASCWVVNREYHYNNAFETAKGATSYTYYMSRVKELGQLYTDITTNATYCSAGVCTLNSPATGVYLINLPSVELRYTHTSAPGGAHVVVLVNGDVTVSTTNPTGEAVKVPPAADNLFILASEGDINIDESVGTLTVTDNVNTQLDGVYTAEGDIVIEGKGQDDCATDPTGDRRLNVGGNLIANADYPFRANATISDDTVRGELINQRSLCSNDNNPSIKVFQRLDFITQLKEFYAVPESQWKEVAP